ncbi:MAG TPA: oxygen-dependent coproporphyrinogen oxidase [Saprospiraceae bacterium]|nr:oxygen-dependent coproporphyrinogen oxidase [Saprospiraceae bacterium]HMQ84903.1 oxygen-dependent coproporphyrinogen oxidase [Saprospiraceae bacterium]
MKPDQNEIIAFFINLQNDICQQLEAAEGETSFRKDDWERPGGGGGQSRVIEGQFIAKGGVNFSAVHGQLSDTAGKALNIQPGPFLATGVSIVLHPANPHVPIIHMNVRYFEVEQGHWWFGGGIDLTPHYIVPEEAQFFHAELKKVCDRYHPDYYGEFKAWADRYFYLKHRKESRGIGGIFFDRLSETERANKAELFAFVQAVGHAFCPIYLHLLHQNKNRPYSLEERQWQHLRRGRYAEFNLIWDQGTRFGLETDGRTESILMSLPPLAAWQYDFQPEAGSREAQTLAWLHQAPNWLDWAK